MAYLFSRGIVTCHSISKSAGLCCPSVSLRFRVQLELQRKVSLCRQLSLLCVNGEEGKIHRKNGSMSMLSTRLSVTPYYVKMIMNGARQFNTSSSLQGTDQATEGPLIYKGTVNTMLKVLKVFSFTSSTLGCAIVPLILYNSNSVISLIFASFVGMTVFTPLLLHWFSKGYVTHIYFNREKDMYTALTYTFLLRPKRLEFTPDDVKVPAIQNMLTSFTAKGVPLLVDDNSFTNPNDVMHLKGYDKLQGNLTLEDLKKLYEKDEGIEQKQ